MSSFRPYFDTACQDPPAHGVAYLRVRATNDPGAHGWITVFLPDGTAMYVRANDLLRFDPSPEVDASIQSSAHMGEERRDV